MPYISSKERSIMASLPTHSVVIIGSGPAGLTAAIYAARANLKPLVFEGLQPGGQLTITTEVENFPGFPEGIMGPEMMEQFRKQAQRFGAQTFFEVVTEVDLGKRPYRIKTDKQELLAETLIISTGATAKTLGLAKEGELMGYGVSACATCDGFFFRDKEVLVIGGGDSAMEEANFLTKFASKVTLVHRRDSFRASKIMQERVLNNPKVQVIWNHTAVDLVGTKETGLQAVVLKDVNSGTTQEVKTDGLFYAIGHQPNTALFTEVLDLDAVGYIKVKSGTTETTLPGVFACGDVMDPRYRQAITAAGTGCMAAIDAEHYLTHNLVGANH
jgi:thioredoxin reductase (NADPH)